MEIGRKVRSLGGRRGLRGRQDPFMKCNIRVLGGLVSGYLLATDSTDRLGEGVYKYQLLTLAEDLGKHFLPAFDTPTGLPYAWVNLKEFSFSNSGNGSIIPIDWRPQIQICSFTCSS